MQTFLPYKSFSKSASILDNSRLGKQRVEAKQILDILKKKRENPNGSFAWKNHPAVLMWEGYENALRSYYNTILTEWEKRGFRNTMKKLPVTRPIKLPPWMGSTKFHRSHQSNLLRKNKEHYQEYFKGVPDDLEYVWPKRVEKA